MTYIVKIGPTVRAVDDTERNPTVAQTTHVVAVPYGFACMWSHPREVG